MSAPRPYVAVSKIAVPPEGAAALETAFAERLGEVEGWPGFRGLEVWRERGASGAYTMVSWWDHDDAFRAYLRSEAHRRSHARMPGGPARPRPAGLSTFEVVAR